MLANTPANLDAFISRIRDLEAIGNISMSRVDPVNPETTIPQVTSLSTQPDLATILKNFGDQIIQIKYDVREVVRSVVPAPTKSWRPPTFGPTGQAPASSTTSFVPRPIYNEVFCSAPAYPLE